MADRVGMPLVDMRSDAEIKADLRGQVKKLIADCTGLKSALESILEFAEQHPLFMADSEDAESEGGDAAFVTVDIAETARKALAALEE